MLGQKSASERNWFASILLQVLKVSSLFYRQPCKANRTSITARFVGLSVRPQTRLSRNSLETPTWCYWGTPAWNTNVRRRIGACMPHWKDAIQPTRVMANALAGDMAAVLAHLCGEEDTLCRRQVDVVLGSQCKEWQNGLMQLLQCWNVEENFVRGDVDAVQETVRNDARQGRLHVTEHVGSALQEPCGRVNGANWGPTILRQWRYDLLPVAIRYVKVCNVDRTG